MASGGSLGSLLLSLLLFSVLGEQLLVFLETITSCLVATNNFSLVLSLSAETGLGDEALDLGRLVESLVLSLDLTANNVLANIILLFVKSEGLDDVGSAFGTETVRTLDIGHSLDFFLTLLHDAEEDGSEISTDDAAAD